MHFRREYCAVVGSSASSVDVDVKLKSFRGLDRLIASLIVVHVEKVEAVERVGDVGLSKR